MPISDIKVPVLETPRLILRGLRRDDFEAMVALWQDPVVVHHFHGKPQSREDTWGRFLRGIGRWAASGYGFWAVEDKASGAFAGMAGVFDYKRDMSPLVIGMPEAGWVFSSRFHGRGYATEAMQAALAWADETLNQPDIFCIIVPENAPSIRVADKLGFHPWFETTYRDDHPMVFKRSGRSEA